MPVKWDRTKCIGWSRVSFKTNASTSRHNELGGVDAGDSRNESVANREAGIHAVAPSSGLKDSYAASECNGRIKC